MKMNLTHAFYGDNTRWFTGVVEEVGTDYPRLGRVRVRIYGIHGTRDEVPISDLPQAQVLVPTTEPGVSGMGRNPYLERGATVFGIFLDGQASQLPLVLGSIPTVEVPSAEQLGNEIKPKEESGVLTNANSLTKTGRRTSDNNTATIRSALAAGNDTVRAPTNAAHLQNSYPTDFNERKQMAWEFFTGKGWTNAQAAGLIGNLIAESNLIPVAEGDVGLHSPTDVSVGIAQWYNKTDRVENLLSFAKQRKLPWTDYRIQMEYVQFELDNITYLGGAQLKKAMNPTDAALIIRRLYERPQKTGGISIFDGKPELLGEGKAVTAAIEMYDTYSRINTAGGGTA